MEKFYKPPFRKFVKKQSRPFQLVIEDEVEKIAAKPDLGDVKKGDLSGFRVHKFSYKKQNLLLAYAIQNADIIFFKIGPRENFYRKLKKYIKELKLL